MRGKKSQNTCVYLKNQIRDSLTKITQLENFFFIIIISNSIIFNSIIFNWKILINNELSIISKQRKNSFEFYILKKVNKYIKGLIPLYSFCRYVGE